MTLRVKLWRGTVAAPYGTDAHVEWLRAYLSLAPYVLVNDRLVRIENISLARKDMALYEITAQPHAGTA